jgi:hypothetical protein
MSIRRSPSRITFNFASRFKFTRIHVHVARILTYLVLLIFHRILKNQRMSKSIYNTISQMYDVPSPYHPAELVRIFKSRTRKPRTDPYQTRKGAQGKSAPCQGQKSTCTRSRDFTASGIIYESHTTLLYD